MPYVNLRIIEGASRLQKARLVEEITESLVQILGKKPEHIHVVIDDINGDNWGFAGRLTTSLKAFAAKDCMKRNK